MSILWFKNWLCFYSISLVIGIPVIFTWMSFASETELSNILIKNTRDNVVINLNIEGIFTEDIKGAISNGMPVSFAVKIFLYKVNNFWLDKKIAGEKVIHTIKYDLLREEYRINRSWKNGDPIWVKDFEKACYLISKIDELKIISVAEMEKEQPYQLMVKLEFVDMGHPFVKPIWVAEADWYSVSFKY